MGLERVAEIAKGLEARMRDHKLGGYDPYPYQRVLHSCKAGKWQSRGNGDPRGDFQASGMWARQVLLSAGNQQGKSICGGANVAIHATGEYPDWWDGPDLTELLRRFPLIWCGGKNNDRVRDICQKALCGDPNDPEAFGTGWIPKARMNRDRAVLKSGVRNAFDSITVQHRAGFLVTIYYKSYDASLLDWAGSGVGILWLDEEPPEIYYGQALARTIASSGYIFMTFTPENGATQVVSQFMTNLKEGQLYIQAGWDDAQHEDGRTHLDSKTKAQLLEAFPPHERDMRTKGVPVLGAGAVFPVALELIRLPEPIRIFDSWPRIGGLDFGSGGVNHPTAAVMMAFDNDAKTAYVYDCYRSSAKEPSVHAQALRARCDWLPYAWPHDGQRSENYANGIVADAYRSMSLRLLPNFFENPPPEGGRAVEPGVFAMYRAMVEGRFKVFPHLAPWFQEFRMYHRDPKDNSIVDRDDDLMSATRLAFMSRRHAVPADRDDQAARKLVFASGVTEY